MKAVGVSVETGAERALSPKRWNEIGQLTWLPDDEGIMLAGRDETSSLLQLWHLAYLNGQAQSVTSDLSDYNGVSLSSDGRALVSVQSQTVTSVWLAPKSDCNHPAQITSGAGRYVDLSWTPEGRVLYASDASGNADIWEMDANGSNQRQLTAGVGRNYAPTATPDGRYIVFHSNRTGVWQIWRMNRDGGSPMQLTNGKENSNWAAVTPDSRFVIYEHASAGAPASLRKVSIDGGEAVRLNDTLSQRPSVSPDGKLIAYWQKESAPGALWRIAVVSTEGGNPVRLFDVSQNAADGNSSIRWTADSRAIIYTDYRDNVTNLRLQPLEGEPKPLTEFTKTLFYSFDIARDGRLLLTQGFTTDDVIIVRDDEP